MKPLSRCRKHPIRERRLHLESLEDRQLLSGAGLLGGLQPALPPLLQDAVTSLGTLVPPLSNGANSLAANLGGPAKTSSTLTQIRPALPSPLSNLPALTTVTTSRLLSAVQSELSTLVTGAGPAL